MSHGHAALPLLMTPPPAAQAPPQRMRWGGKARREPSRTDFWQLSRRPGLYPVQPDPVVRKAIAMYTRFATLLAAALLLAAGPATAQEIARASSLGASSVSARVDGCVRYVAQQAMVVRCAPAERQMAADYGAAFDAQGNPVDSHGDVIATSGGQTQGREVFARERALR